MMLSDAEYKAKFSATNPDKSPFHRHLELCGIKTKNDKKVRAKKFLWGVKTVNGFVWKSIDTLTYEHLERIKMRLSNYPHSFEDEQIGWVFDLMDYAQLNGVHA